MGGATQPFRPAGTATLAATTTSQAVALAGAGSAVLVYNASAEIAYVQLGGSSVVATAASYPVPPGSRALMDAGPFVTYAAAILSTGTGNVYFSTGDGDTY